MRATFDTNGDLLLRVERTDAKYRRIATTFARHLSEQGLIQPSNLMEAGFTGEVTDKIGRKIRFVDGKRVKGKQDEPTAQRQPATKVDGQPVQVVARDDKNGLVKVKTADGQEKTYKTSDVEQGEAQGGKEEPEAPSAKFDGQAVQLLGADPANGLVKIKTPDGHEKVVRASDLEIGDSSGEAQGNEEPEDEPAGYQFYSPNVKEDAKFDSALASLGTAEQAKFLATSNDILDQLGIQHEAENAVGDWKDGAENSVVQRIASEVDLPTMRYTAALVGEMADQKAVLTFRHDPEGPDAVYEMQLPVPIAEARQVLADKGIAFRTLIPTKDGCKVVVFDHGDALLPNLITVGDHFDVTIQRTRGQGEFIGADDREGARGEYRKAIDSYEKEPDRRKYQAGGNDNRRGVDAGKTQGTQSAQKADLKPPLTKDKVTAPPPTKDTAPLYEPDPTLDTTGDGVAQASRVGVPADAVPPPPPIGRLPRLTKNERLVEARFADAFQADPKKMVGAYVDKKNHVVGAVVKAKHHPEVAKAAQEAGFKVKVKNKKDGTPDEVVLDGEEPKLSQFLKEHAPKHSLTYEIGDAPNIFNTDDCKMLSDVYNPPASAGIKREDALAMRSRYNTVLHQTSNAIAKRAFLEYLDKLPEDKKTVLVTSGGVASGKGYALSRVAAVNEIAQKAGAIWDAAGEQNSTENPWIMQECAKRGIKVTFLYVHSNPNETWENPERGVVERAGKIGRMVDARLFADSYTLGAKNFAAFHRGNADKAQFFILDNTGKDPVEVPEVPKAALEMDPDTLYHRSVGYLQGSATVSPAVKRGGSNGLRIWPEEAKKEGKDVAASRESANGSGRTLMESGFTGEITDKIGRRMKFVDGKHVARTEIDAKSGKESHVIEPVKFSGKTVNVIAQDPASKRLKVKLPTGETVVARMEDVDFGVSIKPHATVPKGGGAVAYRQGDIVYLDRADGSRTMLARDKFDQSRGSIEGWYGPLTVVDGPAPPRAAVTPPKPTPATLGMERAYNRPPEDPFELTDRQLDLEKQALALGMLPPRRLHPDHQRELNALKAAMDHRLLQSEERARLVALEMAQRMAPDAARRAVNKAYALGKKQDRGEATDKDREDLEDLKTKIGTGEARDAYKALEMLPAISAKTRKTGETWAGAKETASATTPDQPSGPPSRRRFIAVEKKFNGEWTIRDAMDDIVGYAKLHPNAYGVKYFDTISKTWVKPGKRGPVKEPNARVQYKEVPQDIERLADAEWYGQTLAQKKANNRGDIWDKIDDALHRESVRNALLLGKHVPDEVLADYPDFTDLKRRTVTESSVMESGFTGEIKDSLGRRVHFVDGKRVKWNSGEAGVGDTAAHPNVATLGGHAVRVLAKDPETRRLRVELPTGDVQIVHQASLEFGDAKKAAKPPPALSRPFHGSQRFIGEIMDSEGIRRFYVNGKPVGREEEARQAADSGGEDYELIVSAGPLNAEEANARAEQIHEMASTINVPPAQELSDSEMVEYREMTLRMSQVIREFNSLADRRRTNPKSAALNDEYVRLRDARRNLGKSDLHADSEDEDETDEEDETEEWDGEIIDRDVVTDDYDSITDWSSYTTDRRTGEVIENSHQVELAIGTFTDENGNDHEVYRWQSADSENGDFDDAGDWTTDRNEAERDGTRYARQSDEERPEEENEDSDDLADEDVQAIFGASALDLEVHQDGNEVHIKHPMISDCDRTVGVDSDGKKYIHNDLFILEEEHRGSGFGTEVFAAEVEGAADAWYSYIETHAARSDGRNGLNGYYTWVTLGYDESLNELGQLGAKIKSKVPGAKSVLDLMDAEKIPLDETEVEGIREIIRKLASYATSPKVRASLLSRAEKPAFNGRDYWLAHGRGLTEAKFDLTEGSRSRKVLAQAMGKKKAMAA